MENKNEHNSNSTEPKHPAEKLMQYPIDSDSDDIPKKVVRNPELAEEFAYAEKPYRDLAIESQNHGLDDEAAAILRRGRVAVQRMGIEGKYYDGYETTRNAVRSAIAKDDPAWLNPYHGEELAAAKVRAQQEAIQQKIEMERPILTAQRRYVRALVEDEDFKQSVGERRRFSPAYTDKGENYRILFEQAPESEHASYGDTLFSDRHLHGLFMIKRQEAFTTLSAANEWRAQYGGETAKNPINALDEELNVFFKEAHDLYLSGAVDENGIKLVLDEFDIARYSVDDFRAIADKVRAFRKVGYYYGQETNLSELLEGLYLEEPRDDILAERAEWTRKRDEEEAERREKTRLSNAQRSERNKVAKIARDEANRQEIADKFREVEADFIAGRNATKQRILDSPVGGDVAPMLEQNTADGVYEAVYPNVRALKAALALFTIKRSEEFNEEGHLVPYTGLDIDTLWREKFARPKGYYGGETGQARLTIRKPADNESNEVDRQLKRLDSIGSDEAFVVDITIEGVKGSEVQMTSTLEGVLYTVPDATLPLVRRFTYSSFESTATGDEKRLELEKLSSISRARRLTGEAMASPLSGGLPGLGKQQ